MTMFATRMPKLGQTWVSVDGVICGAQADDLGEIGGGSEYRNRVEPTSELIDSLDELITRLRDAKSGDVLFLDGSAELDCTTLVGIEKLVLEVPGGVTIASNRGERGSAGALIFSDWFATRPLFRVMGPNVRFSGLRIAGPNPKRCLEHHRRSFAIEGHNRENRLGHEYYYKFPISDGIVTDHDNLTVDNCEIGGWSHAAIYLQKGKGHHIHHNFIHHNQYNGLEYGVSHDQAFSKIERNCFNYNRHSIAGTGKSGSGYEACHNVELGESLSHCFDMHGGRDRRDGTDIAGTAMKVSHNTFGSSETALVVRGIPNEGTTIGNNWFYQDTLDGAVRAEGKIDLGTNAFGYRQPVET